MEPGPGCGLVVPLPPEDSCDSGDPAPPHTVSISPTLPIVRTPPFVSPKVLLG